MKNNKLLRALSALLTVFLLLSALPAFAASDDVQETPFEPVYDRAAVLSADTKGLIVEMNDTLYSRTGCRICVVTLDFLDGKHITDVAKGLYSSLKLAENDILTIVCVGEFSYTAYAGANAQKKLDSGKLGQIVGTNLTSKLPAPKNGDLTAGDYSTEDYDSALRAYIPKLCDAVSAAFGVSSDFSASVKPTAAPTAQAASTPAPTEASSAYSADNWLDKMMTWGTSKITSTDAPFNYNENESSGGMHVSFWQIILLLIILRLVFGGKRGSGKGSGRRRSHPYK